MLIRDGNIVEKTYRKTRKFASARGLEILSLRQIRRGPCNIMFYVILRPFQWIKSLIVVLCIFIESMTEFMYTH